jgi:hypothetical protein
MHPNFSSPPIIGFKTSITIATWQSPTFQFKCKRRTTNCFKSNTKTSYTTKSKKVGSIPSPQCTINNPISIIENPKLVTNNVSCHSWSQVGNTMCIKHKSSFVHKNLVDAIEKGNVALVESINWIM